MAIFGDLTEFPLPEAITLVGRRTGQLQLCEVPGCPPMEIHFVEGLVCGLVVSGRLTEDVLEMRDQLSRVMEQDSGIFEFHKATPETVCGQLRLSVTQFTLCLACAVDEFKALREQFPHPRSRFVLRLGADLWLEDELGLFVERAQPLLAVGVDAQTLSEVLGLTLERVQLNLYKLRTVNFIAPVRAYEAPPEDPAVAGRLPRLGTAVGPVAGSPPPLGERSPAWEPAGPAPVKTANRLSLWQDSRVGPVRRVVTQAVPTPPPHAGAGAGGGAGTGSVETLPPVPGARRPGVIRRLLHALSGRA